MKELTGFLSYSNCPSVIARLVHPLMCFPLLCIWESVTELEKCAKLTPQKYWPWSESSACFWFSSIHSAAAFHVWQAQDSWFKTRSRHRQGQEAKVLSWMTPVTRASFEYPSESITLLVLLVSLHLYWIGLGCFFPYTFLIEFILIH